MLCSADYITKCRKGLTRMALSMSQGTFLHPHVLDQAIQGLGQQPSTYHAYHMTFPLKMNASNYNKYLQRIYLLTLRWSKQVKQIHKLIISGGSVLTESDQHKPYKISPNVPTGEGPWVRGQLCGTKACSRLCFGSSLASTLII